MFKLRGNKKINISDFFLLFFLLTHFVVLWPIFTDYEANLLKVIPGLLCFVYSYWVCKRNVFRNGLFITGIMSLSLVISFLYNHNAGMVHVLWVFSYMGVALVLYNNVINEYLIRLLLYAMSLVFVCMMLFGFSAISVLGVGLNAVSAFFVILLFIYLLARNKCKMKWPLYWPSLLLFVVSAWTSTRSGILCAFLFLVGSLVLYVKDGGSVKIFIVPVLVVVATLMFYRYGEISEMLLRKIDNGFLHSSRTEIWKEYISAVFDSIGNFILGPSIENERYALMHHYRGNVHNSFLMLHSKFGIVGFIFMLMLLLKATLQTWLFNKYLLLLLFLALLRSMFDWVSFPGMFDVVYFFYALYGLDSRCCEVLS